MSRRMAKLAYSVFQAGLSSACTVVPLAMRWRIRCQSIDLCREDLRQRAPAPLAHRHDDLALALLVLSQPPVDAIDSQIFRPQMAAEIGTVDLGCPSIAADTQRLGGRCHGLAQFVRQDERRLVLDIEVAGKREHALSIAN
jgi:hypothetical protein